MNARTTWIWVGAAAALFAFIMVFERHTAATGEGAKPRPRLLSFRPADVEGLQVRRSDRLLLDIVRTNEMWRQTFPLPYPVQPFAIDGLLQELIKLQPTTTLAAKEVKASGGLAGFQLDVPVASLVLRHAQGREELRFGAKTAVGDQVYVQVGGHPDVYTVEAAWLERMPEDANLWRDRALIPAEGLKWDRLELRMPNRGFAIQFDPTNRLFYLSKPSPARADQPKVQALLQAAMTGRVINFVEDNPRADLEAYGLVPPVLELSFGIGSNDVATVQFGGSPTNDPSVVYVRNLTHTNIVTVSRDVLEGLATSHTELREKRLLTFDPKTVDMVRSVGTSTLTVERNGEGGWRTAGAESIPIDTDLMVFFLRLMGRLEGDVERDVATDLAAYGLAPPVSRYSLFTVTTNAAGAATNRVLADLEFGGQQEGKVFVRRTDEQSVYSVDLAAVEQLPSEAWQLRDRQVWSFNTNDVKRVIARMPGKTVTFLREGPGNWSLAPGSQGVINDLAVEETIYRLGGLRAEFWVARGGENHVRFGFREDGYKITVVLERNGVEETLEVEFGEANADQFTYARTMLDGDEVVFEFPKKLHFELVRDLMLPFMNQIGARPL